MKHSGQLYPAYLTTPDDLATGEVTDSEMLSPVNCHIHTPYSFSAFQNMEQPFQMARKEGLAVLGINDFYTTGGYSEFADLALRYRIFPLFNIEFMGLQKEEQKRGVRVNDQVNPGRTYLSGKGLHFPLSMSETNLHKMELLRRESNHQTRLMISKLNLHLQNTGIPITLDAGLIERRFTRHLLRERHLAMALRLALAERYPEENEFSQILTLVLGGAPPRSPLSDNAALENEIRNKLLKSGGPAYVPEDEKAFLSLGEVIALITDAGGIPCYPVLLDDPRGNFTEFEENWETMAENLIAKGIFMVELIPGRNDRAVLSKFVTLFDRLGFSITFGTEHNTPQIDPLTVTCRDGMDLSSHLKLINFRGAAVIAAHQYLVANGKEGFPSSRFPTKSERKALEELGARLIINFTKKNRNVESDLQSDS